MRLLDILTSPWAIAPDKLKEIQAVYRAHIRGEKIDVKGIQSKVASFLDEYSADNDRGYTLEDGIAVIHIENVITKKRTLFSFFFGGTSSLGIKAAFQNAIADQAVKAVLLFIDSPGGTVDGTQELANFIYANKGSRPVYAFSDGLIASAAYWIAAAADKTYISSDTVEVGSIGVVVTHIDQSKYDEMLGAQYTDITAGNYKRITSPHKPLSEEGKNYLQDQVDHLYSVFVEDVARMKALSVDQVLTMADGKIFIGTQAVEIGLVDGVATYETVIEKLKGELNMELSELKTKYPDLYQSVLAEGHALGKSDGIAIGKADGQKEGAEAERKRLTDMEALLIPGHESLLASCKADANCTAADFAMKQSVAEKTLRGKNLEMLKNDAVPPVKHDNAPEPGKDALDITGIDPNLPLEEKAKAAWDKNPALREEFKDKFDAYLAFEKNVAAGRIKILGRK
jgi:signal peptide peptidase SppA